MKIILASLLLCAPLLPAAEPIPNRLIDYAQFQKIARAVAPIRDASCATQRKFLR